MTKTGGEEGGGAGSNNLAWSAALACLAVSPTEYCHDASLGLVSGQVELGEGMGVGKQVRRM